MQLLDNVVLDINPNKHAAIIKTITLNTFKTVYFNSAACRSSFMSDWAAWTSLTSALPYVVITRKICRYYEKRCRYYEKICRFNEKRCRYYEKRCRFNEKRSRYNDIIEWKKYYVDGSITSPYNINILSYQIKWFKNQMFLTESISKCITSSYSFFFYSIRNVLNSVITGSGCYTTFRLSPF